MTRILYIDLSPRPGGSTMSLFQLVSHLDHRSKSAVDRSRPALNTFDRFDSVNVPVLRVRTPQWEPPPGSMVDRVRASRVGNEMRKRPGAGRLVAFPWRPAAVWTGRVAGGPAAATDYSRLST